MDFLKIRKKAKERAQARAAEQDPAKAPRERDAVAAPAAPPAAVEPSVPADPAADQELIEGALQASFEALPPPHEPAEAPQLVTVGEGGRFTTWRPGAGAPPVVTLGADDASRAGGSQFAIVPSAASEHSGALLRDLQSAAATGELQDLDPLDEFFYRADEAALALARLPLAESAAEEPPAPLAREEYLTFLLGSEEYAIAIGRVRQVIRAPPITEVPRTPPHVLGVVTVRGMVVTVIDPRPRLGIAPFSLGEGEGKIVIVDAGEGTCGLLVDRVATVVRLRPGSIEPCPQGIAGSRSEFLAGIGRVGERLFTVLDLSALLRTSSGGRDAPRTGRADAGA